METLPDYITLYSKNSQTLGSTMTWNIPDSYYSNTRGGVCYVSLVQSIIQSASVNDNLVIKYVNGVQNQYTTSQNGAVIAMLGVQNGTAYGTTDELDCYTPLITEPIKCLISARPSQIKLDVKEIDDNSVNVGDTSFFAVFTLKFEYFEVKEQIDNLEKQRYLNM